MLRSPSRAASRRKHLVVKEMRATALFTEIVKREKKKHNIA